MRYLIPFLFLFLFSCGEPVRAKYPGHQFHYRECHNLWDLGYKINVTKCEHDTEHPKYRIGQKVKSIKYGDSCEIFILKNNAWSLMKNVLVYTVKVYCENKPMHDSWCERGNLLNCPEVTEDELYTNCKGK